MENANKSLEPCCGTAAERSRSRYWAIVMRLSGESEDIARQNRIFVDGGGYHVYNRPGREGAE